MVNAAFKKHKEEQQAAVAARKAAKTAKASKSLSQTEIMTAEEYLRNQHAQDDSLA